MTSRKDIAKIRRELQETERALTLAEQRTTKNRDFSPATLPDKKTHYNERTSSSDIDFNTFADQTLKPPVASLIGIPVTTLE